MINLEYFLGDKRLHLTEDGKYVICTSKNWWTVRRADKAFGPIYFNHLGRGYKLKYDPRKQVFGPPLDHQAFIDKLHQGRSGLFPLYSNVECTELLSPILLFNPKNFERASFEILLSDLGRLAKETNSLIWNYSPLLESTSYQESGEIDILMNWARTLFNLVKLIESHIVKHLKNHQSDWRMNFETTTTDRAIRAGSYRQTLQFPEERRVVRVSMRIETEGANVRWLRSQMLRLVVDIEEVLKQCNLFVKPKETEIQTGRGLGSRKTEIIQLATDAEIYQYLRELSKRINLEDSNYEIRRKDLVGQTETVMLAKELLPIRKELKTYFHGKNENSGDPSLDGPKVLNTTAEEWLLFERWTQLVIIRGLEQRGFVTRKNSNESSTRLMEFLHFGMSDKNKRAAPPCWLDLQHRQTTFSLRVIAEPNIYRSDRVSGSWKIGINDHPDSQLGPSFTPDLLIKGERHSETWVIDAKYRNYNPNLTDIPSIQKYSKDPFVNDLLDYAVKYSNGLSANVSAIIHCSLKDEHQYWDLAKQRTNLVSSSEESRDFKTQRGRLTNHTHNEFQKRKLISLGLFPGDYVQNGLTKLFRYMFAWQSFEIGTCWVCGIRASTTSGGVNFSCRKCETNWRRDLCNRCRKVRPTFIDNERQTNGVTGRNECLHCGYEG